MSGPVQFDRAKLRASILHTCRNVEPDRLGAVKLHKVLYFLDMLNYAQSGSPVTGATYKKRPFGPTCVPLLRALREMTDDGELEVRETEFHGLRKMEYHAQVDGGTAALSFKEKALLDSVIDFVCHRHSAKSISEFSHQLPWELVDFGEEIPYSSAMLLFPAETSPEATDRIEKELDALEAERSKPDPLGGIDYASFRGRVLAEIGRA